MEFRERKPQEHLWACCMRACSWVTAGSISTQLIRAGRWLILTYLLAPEQIGIVILVWWILGMLQEFTDTGIKHALIQNPRGNEPDYANSAWLISLARGGVLVLIMYFIVPVVTQIIYQNNELKGLLRLSCLIIAFDSLNSVGMILLRKNIKLAPVTIVSVTGHVTGTIAAVILTWILKDARGVVLGEVVTSAVICILSYIFHPYRPKFLWYSRAAKELIGYGIIAYMVTIVDAIGARLDVLMLGRIADESEVAVYGLGMIAILAPCQVFSLLLVQVGFPAFSIIQHDKPAVRKGIKEIVLLTQMLSVPLFIIIALLAPDLVRIMPEKYRSAADVLRWLSIYGFCVVFLRQLTPVLYAVNRVIWCVARAIMQVIIIAVLLVPLYRYKGLVGACWAANSALIITDIFIWIIVLRELNWPWRQWFKDISMLGRAIIAAGTAGAAVYGLFTFAGYDWSGYPWGRCLCCLAGWTGFGAVGLRYYIKRSNGKITDRQQTILTPKVSKTD